MAEGKVRATILTDKVRAQVRAGAVEGLGLAAEHLLQTSRALVPLETGALERSGVASVDADNLRAFVTYDTPYAVPQHENLNYQHDQGRTAKYLETPMHTEADTLAAIVANSIRTSTS